MTDKLKKKRTFVKLLRACVIVELHTFIWKIKTIDFLDLVSDKSNCLFSYDQV